MNHLPPRLSPLWTRSLVVLPLLVACSDGGSADSGATPDSGAAEIFSPTDPYDVAGPWAAGTFDASFTGSTGVDLTVQVWYPSADAEGTAVLYDGLWPGEAWDDATADCAQARPVVVFSHGYGGIRWQSPEIVERLATHGYIVVAPDHTGNTFLDNDDTRFEELLERRPQDLSDSFDWLVDDAGTDPLSGCVDDSAGYAASGHSFGGYTAFVTGGATVTLGNTTDVDLSDPRVWAVLPMAPWDAGGVLSDGTAAITVPVMTLSGDMDQTTSWSQVSSLHGALTVEPRYLGEFANAGHYSFSPIACATGEVGDGCGEDNIDPEEFLGLVSTSALAFLESVRTDPGAIDYRPADSDELSWITVE